MSRIHQMENLVRLHCLSLYQFRPTGHTSAVEMNQRKVRMSILFKFKMFFKFTRYTVFCPGFQKGRVPSEKGTLAR